MLNNNQPEEDRIAWVAKYMNSGLSQRKFYEAENLPVSLRSFHAWCSKYKDHVKYGIPNGELFTGASRLKTWRDDEGNYQAEWLKSSKALEDTKKIMDEIASALKDELIPYPPTPAPKRLNSDLLTTYILADAHVGMLAEAEESSENWDIDIAERIISGWIEASMAASPNSDTALLVGLGDLFHYDSLTPITPASGHILDSSCRPHVMVRTVIRIMRRAIDNLLTKHRHVHIIIAAGNHDQYSALFLREALVVVYENEPRVSVDDTPNLYYAYEWGDTAIFVHHGHKRGLAAVPEVFASLYREIYGRSKYACAHIGHFHDPKPLQTQLMKVEIHPTLAAPDAYASTNGYSSERGANTIFYSKRYGEVGRVLIRPEMVL